MNATMLMNTSGSGLFFHCVAGYGEIIVSQKYFLVYLHLPYIYPILQMTKIYHHMPMTGSSVMSFFTANKVLILEFHPKGHFLYSNFLKDHVQIRINFPTAIHIASYWYSRVELFIYMSIQLSILALVTLLGLLQVLD